MDILYSLFSELSTVLLVKLYKKTEKRTFFEELFLLSSHAETGVGKMKKRFVFTLQATEISWIIMPGQGGGRENFLCIRKHRWN